MESGDARAPLFVYGTLRRGGGKESLLGDARFLRAATVRGSLHDLGAFPALAPGGDTPVHGELWECSHETLCALDSYEGVSEGLFDRVRFPLEEGWCWVYVAGPALRRRLGDANFLPSGRW